jgi:predicted HicB family RNase H-like nuclease
MSERGINARPGNAERAQHIKEQIQKTRATHKSLAMDRASKENAPSKERSGTLLSRSPRMTHASIAVSIAADKP